MPGKTGKTYRQPCGWMAMFGISLSLISVSLHAAQAPQPSSVNTASMPVAQTLGDILATPALARGKLGVHVMRLDTRATVFSQGADTMLIPASNVKLLTTAAALDALGPSFVFKTELFGTTSATGEINGDLALKGYGDPYLTPERVWYLASRMRCAGITRVAGDIIVDDSYFAPEARIANGSEEDLTSHAYMAPAGALSVGFNAVMVHVLAGASAGQPARVLIDPAQDYTQVRGEIITVNTGHTHIEVDVVPEGHRSKVVVRGRIHQTDSGRGFWRRIDNPPLFAGEVIRQALMQQGIVVGGKVRVATVPQDLPPMFAVGSQRLGELVGPLNRYSNNFMAMQLALALGAQRFGAPATWDKAHRALEEFLAKRVGIAAADYTLGNASGLHSVNHMAARQLVSLLAYMHDDLRINHEFIASLAVAASSGTLEMRMLAPPAAHVVRAKTGTLAGASALSGYVTSRDGIPMAFSMLVNGFGHIEDVWTAQDKFAAALASINLRNVAQQPQNDLTAEDLGWQRTNSMGLP